MAPSISLPIFILYLFASVMTSQSFSFIYNGFSQTDVLLTTDGAAIVSDALLRLTDASPNVIGHAFYRNPINIFNDTTHNSSSSPSSQNTSSFSTSFVFSAIPSGNKRGHGLAFTLSPSRGFPGAQGDHYLGILNPLNNGNSSNHMFAVEFDTVRGINDNSDSEGNHVGININSMFSNTSALAGFYKNDNDPNVRELYLANGDPIQVWIDYDGVNKFVNVTLAPLSEPKPPRPLISHTVDLSLVLEETTYLGFSAATGRKTSSHYILGWSFRLNGAADQLNASQLPIPPNENISPSLNIQTKTLIITFSMVIFLLVVALLSVVIYRRKMKFETLEDWEKDCPHRFRYKDLYTATKGFSESELLGVGGFGAVYKGVLPASGAEIAVKKIISNNTAQAMREFAAEIESLGRLRHKHLVNLQGWCKKKNDLLLVYDYVPNGSLHSLLVNPRNGFLLRWEQRFNILKGIAAAILYLHEEWEQVVIHRDVKSSNVLIDADMNGRLGDFGLARLYDRGANSQTTSVVGTIGYIAPELTRTCNPSTSSDVYAYGVLLLEVASGRSPIVSDPDRGRITIVDWVIGCAQRGRVLDAVDEKLGSVYVLEEMELVLGLGLLCSHSRPEARPTMRQIVRYLNGDELLPVLEDLGSVRHTNEITAKFLEMVSIDTTTKSSSISTAGEMSFTSFETGR